MTKNHIKSLSRRKLVTGLGALGTAGMVSACGSKNDQNCNDSAAIQTQKIQLKMVTTWPKNFPGLGTGAQRFADRVGEITGGRITIKLYAAGELVGALGAFDAVSQGKADLYHGAEYYWQGKHKAFPFFTAVPMGLTAAEMNAWIYFGGGQALWDELSGKFNVKALLCGNTGTQMGGWFKPEIKSLEDLQGLKVRMPGLGGEVYRRLGATPVTKAGGEIFQALSQGNIDAAEWVGPWNDLAFGFHTITKNYYTSGIQEPGASLCVGFNKGVWDNLSATDQQSIAAAAAEENNMMYAEYNANNARALKTLTNEHGVKLLQFSDDIRARLAEESAAVLKEVSETDELSKRIYDSFMTFRDNSMYWGEYAEDYYTQMRRDFPLK